MSTLWVRKGLEKKKYMNMKDELTFKTKRGIYLVYRQRKAF